jgi:plasmid stabilization system protein ParE
VGEEFLRSLDARIQAILRTPEMHAVVFENYRRALVRKFPYAIIYEYENNTVTLYAIFHTSRDPEKWRKRLS